MFLFMSRVIGITVIVIIIIIIIPICLYTIAVCYKTRQKDTTQYTTIQYNKIPHIAQNILQNSRPPSAHKITKKNQ